jgi:hypothetical protein
VLAHAPFGGDQVARFEAVEGLINGAVVDVEPPAGALLEPFENLESVAVAPDERLQDEDVEIAFEDGH